MDRAMVERDVYRREIEDKDVTLKQVVAQRDMYKQKATEITNKLEKFEFNRDRSESKQIHLSATVGTQTTESLSCESEIGGT